MRVLKRLGYKIGIISGGINISAEHLRERLDKAEKFKTVLGGNRA